MAKKILSYSFSKAYVDFDDEVITEVTKEGEFTYSLRQVFEEFKDKQVNFSIKEEIIPTPLEDSDEESESK